MVGLQMPHSIGVVALWTLQGGDDVDLSFELGGAASLTVLASVTDYYSVRHND